MKKKPTTTDLQPLFFALVVVVGENGDTFEIFPGRLWHRIQEIAPPEAKASAVWPKGRLSLGMAINTLKPVLADAGIRVTRPKLPKGQGRPLKFSQVKASNQDHDN